jgi:predicted dehydrogenase
MLWMFGDVVSVQASSKAALHAIEVEDALVATLQFANGALGVLQATTSVYPGYARRLELSGSEGTMIIEQDRLLAADLRNPPEDLRPGGEADKNPSASSPVVSDVRGHQSVLAEFLEAIRTDSRPRCDGREGRRSLALVEAIYAACRSGQQVRCG